MENNSRPQEVRVYTSDGLVHSLQDNERLRDDRNSWERAARNLETQLADEKMVSETLRKELDTVRNKYNKSLTEYSTLQSAYMTSARIEREQRERIATLEERIKEDGLAGNAAIQTNQVLTRERQTYIEQIAELTSQLEASNSLVVELQANRNDQLKADKDAAVAELYKLRDRLAQIKVAMQDV